MPELPAKPPRGRVLVVEDEAYVRASLSDLLGARGFEVGVADGVAAALGILGRTPVDVVLSDLRLGDQSGLDLVAAMRPGYATIPIVILTGHGTIASAVACLRAGAENYILKPADPEALEMALDRAIAGRALRSEIRYLRGGQDEEADDPIGISPAWAEVMRRARAAAASDATVLLLGESGTGKELIARLIHRLSRRAAFPYVRVNCAATPVDMWESEFFGHRKGAYTGAAGDRDGRFRLAHKGTLFMDEVGAMPAAAQAKMLRVLEDGRFDRLGDEQPTAVDVRVIAATNSDLEAESAAGHFRRDLFYRLNVVRLDLPPLRDRTEDIPLLAARFAARIAAGLGRQVPSIGPEVLADLAAYPWPGNVRELRNVIERALVLNPGSALSLIDVPPAPEAAATSPDGVTTLRTAMARREKEVVLEAVRHSGGVRKEAARLLGIDQRNLGYYLRKHGIDPDRPDA